MCKLLMEETASGGKNKRLQEARFKRFFDWEKISKSNKLKITQKYDEPKEKIENRGAKGAPYIEMLKRIILILLANRKGEMTISQSSLLKMCKMVNDNYYFGSRNIFKISKFHQMDRMNVEEFFENSRQQFKNDITRVLDILKTDELIDWMPIKKVKDVHIDRIEIRKEEKKDKFGDKYTTLESEVEHSQLRAREATKEETNFIGRTGRQVMLDMGYRSKQTIIRHNKWSEYKKKVDKIILDELNISFYYDAYKINCYHLDHILLEIKELEKFEREFNKNVQGYYMSKANKRKKSAIKSTLEIEEKRKFAWGEPEPVDYKTNQKMARNERRINDDYLLEHNELSKIYLDIDYPKIENEVRKFASEYGE
ncbi:hypothetical protein [Paenibacillus sp. MSJ-34]|uniref:hypothetical protein n=1 Tax=Paenibacillus sp. MSJ-34 TaxID=2841529 RepID=UPI001C0F7631|nr:hypothetical protein [Paenibacillus sp. MSJ-34]MBU5445631.1 hypothetical protein [Paenibacillus sp. MSJ-34]